MSDKNDSGSGDGGQTRTGFGRTLFGKNTTTAHSNRKIQVRSKAGKVYGPFTRSQVVAFIVDKKLTGEEQLLFEGENSWKDIYSDIEFFDLFQRIQSGEKIELPSEKPVEPTRVLPEEQKTIAKTAVMEPPVDKTAVLSSSRPATRDSSRKPRPKTPSPGKPAEEAYQPDWQTFEPKSQVQGKAPSKSQNYLKPVTILIAGIVVASAFFLTKKSGPDLSVPNTLNFEQSVTGFKSLVYSEPLEIVFKNWTVKIPPMPEKILKSAAVIYPAGFTAEIWKKEIDRLMSDSSVDSRSTHSYWLRWSWSLLWLGSVFESIDKNIGITLRNIGDEIFSNLESQKLLTTQEKDLFSAALLAQKGDFGSALDNLRTEIAGEPEIVSFFREELSWLRFWTENAKGEIVFSNTRPGYSEREFEFTSKLRKAFFKRDSANFQLSLTDFADNDPLNPSLWFVTAETNWRLRSDMALANRLFQTGLAVASLWPKSFQWVYWTEYKKFLEVYGKSQIAVRASENLKILFNSDILSSGKQWTDLADSTFGLDVLGTEIYNRSSSGVLDLRDMATLAVLGATLPKGNDYLNVAAQHMALTRKWRKSESFFNLMLERDKNDLRAWGGLIWVNAEQYAFDKAFKYHDELVKIATSTRNDNGPAEIEKFMGVIQSVGLEYDNAVTSFEKALKLNPTDGWSHFLLAQHYVRFNKFVPCLKAANLARINSKGELKLKSELLTLSCRIGARVDIRGALKTLGEISKQYPNNIEVKLTYADGLAAASQVNEAIRYIAEQNKSFPNSFDLRMKMGDLALAKKDYKFAVLAFNRALKEDKENPAANFKIGMIFYEQNNFLEAAQNFETAAAYDENYPAVWLWIARSYLKAGENAKALSAYQKEIELRPSVVATFVEVAEYLLAQNAPQEVPKLFQKFAEDFQDDPVVSTRLAQAYLAMQDLDNAQSFAQSAVNQNPNNPEAHRVLGFVYENMAYFDKAKYHFRKYLELVPQAGDANSIRNRISSSPY